MPEVTALAPDAVLARYDRGFAVLDGVVRAVSAGAWASPSPCQGWTARDVLAHLLWGQDLVKRWATDRPPADPASQDWTQAVPDEDLAPLWESRRHESRRLLTPVVLACVVRTRLFGPVTIGEFLWNYPNDAILHAWDISAAATVPVTFPEDLVADLLKWNTANEHVLRSPGGYGQPEIAPQEAGVVDRWLAFAGRDPEWVAVRT